MKSPVVFVAFIRKNLGCRCKVKLKSYASTLLIILLNPLEVRVAKEGL
jgi:hypothetical protein